MDAVIERQDQQVALAPRQQKSVSLTQMYVGKYNPRTRLVAETLAELAGSLRALGFIQRILTRPVTVDGQDRYEVVVGQRRFLAAKMAFGDDAIIDVDVEEMTEAQAAAKAAAENIEREAMGPAEEARAAARVLADAGGDRAECARLLGWKPAMLADRLKLMACAPEVLDRLTHRKLDLGVCELLAGLTAERQLACLAEFDASGAVPKAADFKAQIQALTKSLAAPIFDTAECGGCPHNSAQQRAMFATTFDDGHCLNGECFDRKVQSALDAKVNRLEEEFQMVKIFRPGDNFSIVKLVAEGPTGVGPAQATACRSCATFGAIVSGSPASLGKVSQGICFNPGCNAEKVGAYQTAIAPPEETPDDASSQGGDQEAAQSGGADAEATGGGHATSTKPGAKAKSAKASKSTEPAKPAEPAKPTVTLSAAVAEYRDQLYRTVIAKELATTPERGLAMLLALAATSKLRTVDAAAVSQVVEKNQQLGDAAASTRFAGGELARTFELAMSIDTAKLAKFVPRLASTAPQGLESNDLRDMVKALKPSWVKHYKLDEDYLKILTKNEIEVLCEQLGLDKALGTGFRAIFTKKKDEIIKAVLAAKDFQYEGAMPPALLP